MERRKTDACIARRLYEWATPYAQLFGWAAVAIPVLITAMTLAEKASAFDARITSLEQAQIETVRNLALINQKADLTIELLRPTRKDK